jgi:hypothetical protein
MISPADVVDQLALALDERPEVRVHRVLLTRVDPIGSKDVCVCRVRVRDVLGSGVVDHVLHVVDGDPERDVADKPC